MEQNFTNFYNAQDFVNRFNNLPCRIFIDTNVLQYFLFGSYLTPNQLNIYKIGPKSTKYGSRSTILGAKKMYILLNYCNVTELHIILYRERDIRKN